MARAIWSGSISFGLVNVPVRMVSAVDEQDLHFHLLHAKDDSRIGYEKVCKQESKPVPDGEIVTAYEVADGEYVYMTEEDFQAAEGSLLRTIDVREFVPFDEIDPVYFERTYHLAPDKGGERVYALFARAMDDAGLAGIGTFVMRNKQHLGCLRFRDGVIALERMYFADEIRSPKELRVKGVRVDRRELEMAAELIDRFTSHFDITKYRDEYRESLLRVIRAKRRGKEVHVEPRKEPEVVDLMEALRASIEARKRGRADTRRHRRQAEDLETLTKDELGRRARRARVRGYSRMSKGELVDALRAA
jgi:DNA end-binding protein Ku